MSVLIRHSNYSDKYQNITSVVTVILLKKTCLNLRSIVLLLCCKLTASPLKLGCWQLAASSLWTNDILGVMLFWSNTVCDKRSEAGFPGGAVVENPPANAGDTGLSPGPGRSLMPRSN